MPPAAPPRSRRTRTESAPRSRRKPWLFAALAVLVLGGFAAYYRFVLANDRRHHELPVAWPADAPTGEPVAVGHAVKPGDVFLTTVEVESGVLLGFAQPDPMGGMRLDGTLRVGHAIETTEAGLESHVRVVLHLVRATYEPMREAVAKPLRGDPPGYTVRFRRDAQGRPLPGTVEGAQDGAARAALDTLTAGLSDVATNWLPARDVRLGETWDVAEVSDVLPRVAAMLARAPGAAGAGFPRPSVRGRVGAQALETRDGEPCLRLSIALSATQEGTVGPPALEGWVTGAGRIEGRAWVATATGILWGYEFDAELLASYLVPNRATERHARQRIVGRTQRTDRLPE